MRGDDNQQEGMFSYVSSEKRVPEDPPLRAIRKMVDEILEEMSPKFQKLYSDVGRPSIAPERLLRSLLLQIFYSVRSERMLIGHSNIRITERHYAPWTRSRQEQIEADLRAGWSNDPVIGEVHAGYKAKRAARTPVFSRRRIGRGGGDRTHVRRLGRFGRNQRPKKRTTAITQFRAERSLQRSSGGRETRLSRKCNAKCGKRRQKGGKQQ
jgi:hypothetical protein